MLTVKGTQKQAIEIEIEPKAAWKAIRKHLMDGYGLPEDAIRQNDRIGAFRRQGGHNDDIEFEMFDKKFQTLSHLKFVSKIIEVDELMSYNPSLGW